MEQTRSNFSVSNRRLARATQYVEKQWMPVNARLLKRIRESLDSGAYELDFSFLLDEIKLDYGLFLTCLRGVTRVLKEKSGSVPQIDDPLKILEYAGYGVLKSILQDDSYFSDMHNLDNLSQEQTLRIKECVISASTVQALLKELKQDGDKGFSVALLRQLGMTLIAWNYPTIYKSAIDSSSADLDDYIIQQLGFSPQALAFQVVYGWGLCEDLQDMVMGSSGEDNESFGSSDAIQEMVKLCEVGETLAKACHPESFPEQVHPWREAREVVLNILGDGGIRLIQNQVKENAREYLESFRDSFKDVTKLNPDLILKHSKQTSESNDLISSCPKTLQTQLAEVYRRIDLNNERAALAHLVKEVIPAAGFCGGVIFILDPMARKLVPKVLIDETLLIKSQSVSLSGFQDMDSPVLAGYNCSTPITENLLESEVGYVSYISGVLGAKQRAGVLYLEMQTVSLQITNAEMRSSFKAIQKAFCDCLKLR